MDAVEAVEAVSCLYSLDFRLPCFVACVVGGFVDALESVSAFDAVLVEVPYGFGDFLCAWHVVSF